MARQKLRVKTVQVVNIEHGGWKKRRKIHSLRWPGENKREKGNREGRRKKKRSRGWWFRILSVVVACSTLRRMSYVHGAYHKFNMPSGKAI